MRRGVAAAVLALGLAACGPSGTSSGPGHSNSRLLTTDDIRRVPAGNLYDAIQQLRPVWLTARYYGGSRGYPMVFMGPQRYGDLETLRTLPTDNVREIRFYNTVEAATRFGRNLPYGVIQVVVDIGG